MSGPHDGPNCTCRHDGTQWVKRCVMATIQDRADAARWAADHVREHPEREYTAAYLKLAAEGGLKSTCNEDLR